MKRLLTILAALFVITSCLSSSDWEKDFTGTWDLIGITDVNWDEIKDLRNFQMANVIDNSALRESNMTFEFGNGKFGFSSDYQTVTGAYTVDKDGIVSVDWGNDMADVYWMYVRKDYLYMLEYGVDEDGGIASEHTAFKYKRVSK